MQNSGCIQKKKLKISSFKKPKELQLKYLAWNIFQWVSIKFVQIKTLGSKLAPPQGVIDFPYMHVVKT
jgi:hypothetical protein